MRGFTFLLFEQSTAAAKSSGENYQRQIMRSLEIDDNDDKIRRFADPQYWISYFPSNVKRGLEMMRLKVSFNKNL